MTGCYQPSNVALGNQETFQVELVKLSKKDRIDALGAGLLIGQAMLLGLNQVLIKIVNTGMAPVFQAGMRQP